MSENKVEKHIAVDESIKNLLEKYKREYQTWNDFFSEVCRLLEGYYIDKFGQFDLNRFLYDNGYITL